MFRRRTKKKSTRRTKSALRARFAALARKHRGRIPKGTRL